MFGGFWFRTFLDRWAATAGRYEGAPARKRPCCSRVLLVDLLNLLSIDGGDTRGGHERDLSIKCGQFAVSESKTTRAARSRECTAPRQGGGAHARDSSIARCTRPSAVRHSTQ